MSNKQSILKLYNFFNQIRKSTSATSFDRALQTVFSTPNQYQIFELLGKVPNQVDISFSYLKENSNIDHEELNNLSKKLHDSIKKTLLDGLSKSYDKLPNIFYRNDDPDFRSLKLIAQSNGSIDLITEEEIKDMLKTLEELKKVIRDYSLEDSNKNLFLQLLSNLDLYIRNCNYFSFENDILYQNFIPLGFLVLKDDTVKNDSSFKENMKKLFGFIKNRVFSAKAGFMVNKVKIPLIVEFEGYLGLEVNIGEPPRIK